MRLSEHLTSSSVAALGNSSKLDCTRLSPHFTLGELTKTKTGIENVSNEEQVTGCAVDIRCIGIEQALRYAAILLDISDLNKEDFDELLIEQKGRVIWIHFAVKPTDNRRRTARP